MNPDNSSTANNVCSINDSLGMPVWPPWVSTARMMSDEKLH
jgi:hypothetical protein